MPLSGTGERVTPVLDFTVSLGWNRDTGETQIVEADIRDESLLVFPITGANAGEVFRHPFRLAQ